MSTADTSFTLRLARKRQLIEGQQKDGGVQSVSNSSGGHFLQKRLGRTPFLMPRWNGIIDEQKPCNCDDPLSSLTSN